MKAMTKLFEGGNVFKGPDKEPLTRRIKREEIPTTIAFLEKSTGVDFTTDKDEAGVPIKWLGTTGRKTDSGDLDLSVDANELDKKEFAQKLVGIFGKDSVKLSGDSVHLKTPINGDPAQGFAQTDFMFSTNPKFQQGSMLGGGEGSPYKGEHRHILLSSIARARGLKYSPKFGLVDPETNEPVAGGDDWNTIAKQLLGQTATTKDIRSVEAIINYIKKLPNYEELVAAAQETLGRSGIELPKKEALEHYTPNSPSWMRKIMDMVR
jgi:hypothetical protein